MLSRVAIASFLAMTVTSAGAQPTEVDAEALYSQGRDLVAAGKIAEACAAFEKSYRLDSAVTTIIALATCREKLGRLGNAWELFRMAERQTNVARDNTTTQLHTIAHERAAKLEPRVPRLTINVPAQSRIDGLEILRDTVSIPAGMWNQGIPIDGGTYTITARVPGAKVWSTTVTLASESDTKTVDIPELRNAMSSPEASAVNQPGDKLRTIPFVARTFTLEQGGKPLADDERNAVTHYQKYPEFEPSGRGAVTARIAAEGRTRSIAPDEDAAKRKAGEEMQRPADEAARRKPAAEQPPAADPPKRKAAKSARRMETEDAARPTSGLAAHENPRRLLPPRGRGLRIAGLATGATGVVALGVGVGFGVRATRISAEAAQWDRFDQARFDQGKAAERNMFILTGAGATVLVTGGVLYYLGHRADTTEDNSTRAVVTFAPTIALGRVTFAAVGRF
jgi:hypothetical protein